MQWIHLMMMLQVAFHRYWFWTVSMLSPSLNPPMRLQWQGNWRKWQETSFLPCCWRIKFWDCGSWLPQKILRIHQKSNSDLEKCIALECLLARRTLLHSCQYTEPQTSSEVSDGEWDTLLVQLMIVESVECSITLVLLRRPRQLSEFWGPRANAKCSWFYCVSNNGQEQM